jgi:hypothetical protein
LIKTYRNAVAIIKIHVFTIGMQKIFPASFAATGKGFYLPGKDSID